MKSMRPEHAPHRRPWLPIRVRQTMQTGGRKRSATGLSKDRNARSGRAGSEAALIQGVLVPPSSPSLTDIPL